MKTSPTLKGRWLACAALLFGACTASAHIGYGGRDFGVIAPGGAPVTITGQKVTGNYGWADGTDDDFGDSHRVCAFRFTLSTSAYVTIHFSGSTNGGALDGTIKPAFSIYRGLANLPPRPVGHSADYDTSAISLAYLATLPGPAKEGAFNALGTWRVGGDFQQGPAFDFEDPVTGLSTFVYMGHVADGDAALFGAAEGIEGDGNADGTVKKSLFLPAGEYSIFVGGANYGGQTPEPDATVYGLTGTVSATVFEYAEGDPQEGGVGYAHQVTIGPKSGGHFSGHVGAWSWEDNALFGNEGQGTEPVGWTHTSHWLALRVQQDMNLTITMQRDANVPWPSSEDPDRKADTSSMFPSFTIWKNWDNDGGDSHAYNNRGNVDWAEDLEYVTHVDNSTSETITRTYFFRAGDYTMALGSNAPATNLNRQGYKLSFATTEVNRADPQPGGIGYTYTVIADADSTGSFSSHVGAWSWEDNALFGGPGQSTMPVGWTHTSNWMALKLTEDAFFTLTLERDANVPWPAGDNPDRKADTSSMFPSLTLYRGWHNTGGDSHTYNNRGNISWASGVRYMDHADNSTKTSITRTWRLPPGEYTFALGSNAPATNSARQGYKATFSTRAGGNIVNADPAGGGVGYSHVLSIGRGDRGSISNHVGAWSWEDNALFNAEAGEPPVGWTHTSRWVAVHVRDHVMLNLTMARDATVPWPSMSEPARLADVSSMFPSFTLWRGWDNDGEDNHTYNNRGNVDWAEDLFYMDHFDNSSAETITRSYTLAPGYYTFALGSNAPATNSARQGFSFSWTTSTPAFLPPMLTQQPRAASVLEGRGVSFSVKATGPGLEYQWTRNGGAIQGANRDSYRITAANVNDAGEYACTVRNSAGSVVSQSVLLTVVTKPVVAAFDIPNLVVGQWYQLQLTATPFATAFAVKGLPKGLVVNPKTGLISGRPTEVRSNLNVEVTAINPAGVSAKVTDDFDVTHLRLGHSSSYTAPLARSVPLNNLLGGCVKFQVTSLGTLTGVIHLGASAPIRIVAPLDTSAESPTADFRIPRRGLPELRIRLTLDDLTKRLFGSISDGAETLPFEAIQPVASVGDRAGDYTMAFAVDVVDESIPQGYSIGAFKVSANGLATGVLQMADHSTATFSASVDVGGLLAVFTPLYKGAGSVLGLLEIAEADQDLSGSDVSWFKGAVLRDLVYGEGFGPVDLTVIGRKYRIPAATELPMGLTPGAGNAAVVFAEGGAPDPATRLNTNSVEVSASRVVITDPNPGKVKLSLDAGKAGRPFAAGRTGSFKGSFELTDTAPSTGRPLKRTANFQGMIVDDGSSQQGYGYFILPKLPTSAPRSTLANSPRLSGRVELRAD